MQRSRETPHRGIRCTRPTNVRRIHPQTHSSDLGDSVSLVDARAICRAVAQHLGHEETKRVAIRAGRSEGDTEQGAHVGRIGIAGRRGAGAPRRGRIGGKAAKLCVRRTRSGAQREQRRGEQCFISSHVCFLLNNRCQYCGYSPCERFERGA